MLNRSPKSRRELCCLFESLEVRALLASHPSVADVSPANRATNVPADSFISSDVNLVGVGQVVDGATLNKPGAVTLIRVSDGASIPGVANTTGGGDAIIFTPSSDLDLNTKYQYNITATVKDTAGHSFTSFTSTFTTSPTAPVPPPTDVRFDKITLPNATGRQFTAVAVGPDHHLYVADQLGYIVRYEILDDGTLGNSKTITTVRDHSTDPNHNRLITGLIFAGSNKHPDVYVSHGYSSVQGSPDNSGKISLLTGTNLENYRDLVINLPRSFKDHLTDQMAMGPDGAIYFCQPSMTAMGAPDNTWGLRSEHLLSGTILRLDLGKLGSSTLDARTADQSGSYDPFGANAPLTIYADGVRNSYDVIWTSDGHLFAATNGSAGGGNTPAGTAPYTGHRIDSGTNGPYTGPDVPGENAVVSQPDYLYDIKKGGYYGHPNPLRDEYVMNGGNPTSGVDKGEVSEYPVGTQPDRNYRGFAFSFGQHESPDGGIEYLGNAFGGKLNHQLLYVQYSGGDNIVALSRSGGTINKNVQNIVGFTGFVDPLDLSEDTTNGNIYVAEYGGEKITLLKPDESDLVSGATVTTDKNTMVFNAVKGISSRTETLIVKNKGDAPLTVSQLVLTGDDPNDFKITSKPPLPIKLQPGADFTVSVAFRPSTSTATGTNLATLRVKSSDSTHPDFNVALRGYATVGSDPASEPSLQHILDLYQLPINVGDTNPDDPNLPIPTKTPNDEITAQLMTRADTSKPVSFETLASFSADASTLAEVGLYSSVDGTQAPLFKVLDNSLQQVDVSVTGTQMYSPGKNPFGVYVTSPQYNHTSFSQDSKNTWDLSAPARGRVMRFYPLKSSSGTVVANAYVVAVEMESASSDQQDLVMIIRNVKPVAVKPPAKDTTPPAPPTNLAVLGTAGAVSLDWSASASSDTAGYIVKRSTNSKTNFIQINQSLITDSAFTDTTVGQKRYFYRVFAQDTSGNLSDPAKTAATVTPVSSNPAPKLALTSTDIGKPTPAGTTNALVSGNAYDMLAGGADVQGSSDQFRFAYTTIKGNFDLKVRIESLSAADVWSKAGIMVRSSLHADASNVFALTSPTKYRMTYRTDNGGTTAAAGAGVPTFPNNWLRLTRVGDTYTAYASTDGSHWSVISSVTANLGKTLFLGLAATSHNTAHSTTVQFRDLA